MAGRCLGELVRKMGDRILSQIVPILKQGMTAEEASTRQVRPPSGAHQDVIDWFVELLCGWSVNGPCSVLSMCEALLQSHSQHAIL